MDTKYSTVITRRGLTWDRIAYEVYGDAFLFGDILDANPEYANTLVFTDAVEIKVPVRQSDPVIKVQTPWTQGTTVRIATWG